MGHDSAICTGQELLLFVLQLCSFLVVVLTMQWNKRRSRKGSARAGRCLVLPIYTTLMYVIFGSQFFIASFQIVLYARRERPAWTVYLAQAHHSFTTFISLFVTVLLASPGLGTSALQRALVTCTPAALLLGYAQQSSILSCATVPQGFEGLPSEVYRHTTPRTQRTALIPCHS